MKFNITLYIIRAVKKMRGENPLLLQPDNIPQESPRLLHVCGTEIRYGQQSLGKQEACNLQDSRPRSGVSLVQLVHGRGQSGVVICPPVRCRRCAVCSLGLGVEGANCLEEGLLLPRSNGNMLTRDGPLIVFRCLRNMLRRLRESLCCPGQEVCPICALFVAGMHFRWRCMEIGQGEAVL